MADIGSQAVSPGKAARATSKSPKASRNTANQRSRSTSRTRKKQPEALKVEIVCEPMSTFQLPLSLLLQREGEMVQAAEAAHIPQSQWSGSRLYKLWKQGPLGATLRLTPQESSILWTPWLTLSLQGYFKSGNFFVPKDAEGHQVIGALEYCGILTVSQDTFTFESLEAYERIQRWSSYLLEKDGLVEWLQEQVEEQPQMECQAWVVVEEDSPSKEYFVSADCPARPLTGPSDTTAKALHHVFEEVDSPEQVTLTTQRKIRQDFTDLLQSRLSETAGSYTVTFQMERLRCRTKTLESAVSLPLLSVTKTSYKTPLVTAVADPTPSPNWQRTLQPKTLRFSDHEMIQLGASPQRETFYPYGKENDLVSKARKNSLFQMDYIPHKQSQTSPCIKEQQNNRRKLSPENVLVTNLPSSKPSKGDDPLSLKYINTDFGDLRSVTSALSGPFLDGESSTVLDHTTLDPSTVYSKRTKNSRSSSAKKPLPVVQETVDTKEEVEMDRRRRRPSQRERATPRSSDPVEPDDSGSNSGSKQTWQGFLAGLCEAITPGESVNNRSTSPVRQFVVLGCNGEDDTASQVAPSSSRSPTVQMTPIQAMKGCPAPNPEVIQKGDTIVKAAKSLGTSLGQSIEELVRIALEEDSDGGESKRVAPKSKPPPKMAATPVHRSRSAPSNKPRTSIQQGSELTRSRTEQKPRIPTPKPTRTRSRSQFRPIRPDPALSTDPADAFGLPDSFGSVALPPRKSSARRSRTRAKIARKKTPLSSECESSDPPPPPPQRRTMKTFLGRKKKASV